MAQNDAFIITDSSLIQNDTTKTTFPKTITTFKQDTVTKHNLLTPIQTIYSNSFYKPKPSKPFTHEGGAGLIAFTDGWGVFYHNAKSIFENAKTSDKFYKLTFFQISLQEHKDPKEFLENVPSKIDGVNSKPFVYGKVNNFYALNLGYGSSKMIAGKPAPGTVSIHWMYSGGLSIGFEKPYYIDMGVPYDTIGKDTILVNVEPVSYYGENGKYFLRKFLIIGHTSWSKGLSETKVIPGFHLNTALHFDFAFNKETVSSVETGIHFEYFSRPIEIMAMQTNKPYFISGYISFLFGKRR